MTSSSHARKESFGDFVAADTSERPIIDLRGVEAKLDAERGAATGDTSASAAQPAQQAPDLLTNDVPEDNSWSATLGRTISNIVALPQQLAQQAANATAGSDQASQDPGRKVRNPTITDAPINVTLRGRREDTDVVIDEWHASRLHTALPRRLRLGRSWHLVYSLDQHGSSLATLYNRVAAAKDPARRRTALNEQWLRGSSDAVKAAVLGGPVRTSSGSLVDSGLMIAIRDMRGHVFGAYVNEQLRPCQHYYGNGECFLWKTVKGDDGKGLEVYRWTSKNDYMVLTESTFLSVGGGDGKYGLWVDSSLSTGQSSWCPAFDNTILCDNIVYTQRADDTHPGKFQCLGVEVWAIGE
ncbi:oxidation resistance protein 1 [Malassezia cuniculi]|uniref:Oxidation resistance protein 1 n=1 Tax=Malassezia cuniculi TaxID=948313 RepID=A0AAF0ESI8_9BASI|nr:oxidation resistance protein 1 [Malassezia cuniculi]